MADHGLGVPLLLRQGSSMHRQLSVRAWCSPLREEARVDDEDTLDDLWGTVSDDGTERVFSINKPLQMAAAR